MELVAWQNQLNRWSGQIGALSAYGILGTSAGGTMQDALVRSHAIQQYLNGLSRQYGLKSYSRMGKRFEDWMDWFDDLNRLNAAPTQPQTRAQVISRLPAA
jgi:hypothetical protein